MMIRITKVVKKIITSIDSFLIIFLNDLKFKLNLIINITNKKLKVKPY